MRAVAVALIRRLPGVLAMCLATPVAFVCLAGSPASPASAESLRTQQTLNLWLGTSGSRKVTGLAPGDTVRRVYNVGITAPPARRGAEPKITLNISATRSSILDTSLASGLKLRIDRCTVAWKQRGAHPNYACPGRTTTVFAWAPIAFLKPHTLAIASAAQGTQHLLLTFQLPSSAGNAFEAQASVLAFHFSLGS
jgi:hypothetical protein